MSTAESNRFTSDDVTAGSASLPSSGPTHISTPIQCTDQSMDEVDAKKEKPKEDAQKSDDGPTELDLAIAMDCTGSMGSYIESARNNVRLIVEEIVSKEQADVRLALVEYRDHPPQDRSFVTREHDFTTRVKEMKQWLDNCSASGGGDEPEAVADALHAVLKLSWRPNATKICVFVADAPPHGLGRGYGDGFPNGCPAGLDPMRTAQELAQQAITVYVVGCEPSITRYQDWFQSIALITSGQYVPLRLASELPKVIVGGAAEEMGLKKLMEEATAEVLQHAQVEDELDEDDLAEKIQSRVNLKMKKENIKIKQLKRGGERAPISEKAQIFSKFDTMESVRNHYAEENKNRDSSDDEDGIVESLAPAKRGPRKGFFGRLRAGKGKASDVPLRGAAPPSMAVAERACIRAGDSDELEEMPDYRSAPLEAAATRVDESYAVEEADEIHMSQVFGMVQRAIYTNNLKSRVKKK